MFIMNMCTMIFIMTNVGSAVKYEKKTIKNEVKEKNIDDARIFKIFSVN